MTTEVIITDNSANPAPLGLLGFGLTTILLNFHNAGLYSLDTMILGMGIFVGGIAQLIAGIMENKKKNTFGFTAFCAYGSFWLSLVALVVMPYLGMGEAPSKVAMGMYLLMWGIFTLGMFVGTLKLTRSLQFIFGSLTVLFFLLALGDFTGNHVITQIAGFEGIICGASAVYTCLGQVINEVHKKTIFPL